MDSAEAFAAIALCAVACDGSLGKKEAHDLRGQLEYRSPYRDCSEAEMGDLFDHLLTALRRDNGLHQLINDAIPALTSPQQETALALAAQLVHADQVIEPEETAFLATLCERMTLPTGKAEAIVEAIMVLNRDSLAS